MPLRGRAERWTRRAGPRWRRMSLLLAVLALRVTAADAADDFTVEARRHGSAVEVSARATLHAPFPLIWQTLTDYDHLAQFIPGMRSSRVVDRRGTAAIVAQAGEAGFLAFRYPINVLVESDEHAPTTIAIRVLAGNLRQLDGGYRLERSPHAEDQYVLSWSGIIEPDIDLPMFISVPLLRANLAEQFLGMVKEIERREALRRGALHD
jgi:Polyketide cyclase / dehydrase and lipid transport